MTSRAVMEIRLGLWSAPALFGRVPMAGGMRCLPTPYPNAPKRLGALMSYPRHPTLTPERSAAINIDPIGAGLGQPAKYLMRYICCRSKAVR